MFKPSKLTLKPQHLHWQVGRYVETFTAGPYARTRGRVWVPMLENEQHNLLLDNAYELMGSNGLLKIGQYAAVGTGATTPAATDIALVAEVVRTATQPSGEPDTFSRPADGVYNITRIREFTESQVGGQNLTEWGYGVGPTVGAGDLMTRELFRDTSGNPVTLTLASDQRLRLYYTYQVTLTPATATAFSIPIAGHSASPITGNYVLNHYFGDRTLGSYNAADLALIDFLLNDGRTTNIYMYAYDTALPASYTDGTYLTSSTATGYIGATPNPYAVGSRVKTMPALTFGVNSANFDIAMFSITTDMAKYRPPLRLVLDTPLTKDNLHKLTFNSWDILSW